MVFQARVMQRVRIGLTGLACVFLLVLVGTASMGSDAPAARPSQPEEPLAQLGIAPGGSELAQSRQANAGDGADQPVHIAPPPAPVLDN